MSPIRSIGVTDGPTDLAAEAAEHAGERWIGTARPGPLTRDFSPRLLSGAGARAVATAVDGGWQ